MPNASSYMPKYQTKYELTSNAKSKREGPAIITEGRTMDEIIRWTRDTKEFWRDRNTRFQTDQELFELKRPDNLMGREDDLLILPDPRILVKKVSRLIARHPNIIDVEPLPGVPDATIAQRIENFLYGFDQSLNFRWMQGLNNPYRYDQAFFLLLRGWLTERTMFYPDGIDDMGAGNYSALWDHQIIDPATVYPFVAGNKIRRVIHSYATTAGELKSDPYIYGGGKLPDWIKDLDDKVGLTCDAIYWEDKSGEHNKKPSWHHAILVSTKDLSASQAGNEYLKKPTEIGYNPWTITTANGASYRQTEWDFDGYVKHIGTGILDESVDTFKYINKMATKLSELLTLEANPPASLYTEDGKIAKASFSPGARNFFTPRDKIELHRVGPNSGDYQLLWEILTQRLGRAGLPNAFFAEYGQESGFNTAVIMAAGKDILFPFVEAINFADALKYQKVLEQYRDFGPSQPLPSYMEPTAKGDVASAYIDAYDIQQQGTFVKIRREDMTPQEYATRINIALAMLREKAISLERFRKEYAGIKNPHAENRQVVAEMVYMDENVIKQLVPIALSETGKDMLAQVWQMAQQPMPMDPGMMAAQGGQEMPPEMQQGGGVQLPMGGPPVGAVEGQAAVQTNDRFDPNVAALNPIVQLLQSGALGGTGGGGTPPIQGTGSPIQLPQPFFRR